MLPTVHSDSVLGKAAAVERRLPISSAGVKQTGQASAPNPDQTIPAQLCLSSSKIVNSCFHSQAWWSSASTRTDCCGKQSPISMLLSGTTQIEGRKITHQTKRLKGYTGSSKKNQKRNHILRRGALLLVSQHGTKIRAHQSVLLFRKGVGWILGRVHGVTLKNTFRV